MDLISRFPGLAGLTCPLYDDAYVEQLIVEGEQLFRTSAVNVSPREEKIFPKGKPALAGGIVKYIDAEVGDDLLVVSNNYRYLCTRLDVLEMLGMKVSEKDTAINSGIGNFAEGLVKVPRKYAETWLSYKSLGTEESFGFVDVPKIRHLLPVRTMRTTWSSSDIGKFSDFGNGDSWVPKTLPNKVTFALCGLVQDASLGATSRRNCVYMPRDFGGAGKQIPFGTTGNFQKFLQSWKNGIYMPMITTVIKQANRFLQTASMGRVPGVPKLLEHFTKCEPVFHDWVKDNLSITALRAEVPSDFDNHIAGSIQYGHINYWILPQLVKIGRAVTETAVQVALQHNALSRALVSAETYPEFLEKKRLAHEDWRKNNRLNNKCFTSAEVLEEVRLFGGNNLPGHEVHRFFQSATGIQGFRRLVQSERVYWPECLDEIYASRTMHVRGLYASPNISIGRIRYVESWDFQERDRRNTEWAPEPLEEWARGPRTEDPPQIGLDSDHIIETMVSKAPLDRGAAIVTDDVRLCRKLSESGRIVIRVPVRWYMKCLYFGDGEDTIKGELNVVRTVVPWDFYLDNGSIQSGEERYFRDGSLMRETYKYVQDWDRHWSQGPEQTGNEVEDLDYGDLSPPFGWPNRFLMKSGSRKRDYTRA
jgi:hypothetical protein